MTPSERQQRGEVKTSLWLPRALWTRAKVRAMAERRDLRDVIVAALELYLSKKGGAR